LAHPLHPVFVLPVVLGERINAIQNAIHERIANAPQSKTTAAAKAV